MTVNAQGKAQKRTRNILSLHVRLLLGIETAYNNNNIKTKQNKTPPANTGKGVESDFQCYHIFWIQMSNVQQKNHKTYKQESVVH